ncbi:CPBP family intramembrane metalloprotease [Labilibacter sediminis]|nr:CPBP family intramembrane metalloprotease [Labilibacter sediminis]
MSELNKKVYPGTLQSWGICGIAVVAMLAFLPINMMLNSVLGKEPSLLIYYLLSMGAPLSFAYYIRKKETGQVGFNFINSNVKVMVLIILATLSLQIGIVSPIVSLIPIPDIFKPMFLEMAKLNGVFAFITLVIAAPVLEEMVFRGIILDGLLKKHSPFKSIFISSLLFGLVHLNPWQFLAGLLIGFLLGWIYYKTKNLVLPILIHLVNNGFAFMLMRFADAEESFNQSVVETYGGVTNTTIYISVSVLVLLLTIYLLSKEFRKEEDGQIPVNEIEG